jgi:hypothetical protein
MDLFHLRIFNEFINEGARQTQLIQYAKSEAAAVSAGMANPSTSVPAAPSPSPTPAPTLPPSVSPQACLIQDRTYLTYADVCSVDKSYQFWSAAANGVLRYWKDEGKGNIVVAPSYDTGSPAADQFRFFARSGGLSLQIKNVLAMSSSSSNYVHADTLDGDYLWGDNAPSLDGVISYFYVRQLPGFATHPRDSTLAAPRVAIEADVRSCNSDQCNTANNDGKRYFVSVQNNNAKVVGTTAKNEELGNEFVFYLREHFRVAADDGFPLFKSQGNNCNIL